jgi:YaiO family outer membrane protein
LKIKTPKNPKLALIILFLSTSLTPFIGLAQSSDELFQKAREYAFKKDDHVSARELCKEALVKSPNYSDISIFLGRLYTWDKMYDSARAVLYGVIKRDTLNYDAYNATIDLEYWSDNYNQALKVTGEAIMHYPKSEEFLLKRSKVFAAAKDYTDAFNTLEVLFKINNTYPEAIALAERLQEEVRINAITLTYDFDSFNKTFVPWHAVSLAYSRQTPIGSIIGRINVANRFQENGIQYEVDMYPRFAEGLYAYLNAGYSKDNIFPDYRLGASLYYSLPLSFEIDAGIRYLNFGTSDDVKIWTGALGKYYSNFWFSLRTYITPSISRASHSYTLTARYYLSGADDYIELNGGWGISPDDRANNTNNLLVSRKFGAEYQTKLSRAIIGYISAEISGEEFVTDNIRSRYSAGIGIKTLF